MKRSKFLAIDVANFGCRMCSIPTRRDREAHTDVAVIPCPTRQYDRHLGVNRNGVVSGRQFRGRRFVAEKKALRKGKTLYVSHLE
jgi:hypothetical protein